MICEKNRNVFNRSKCGVFMRKIIINAIYIIIVITIIALYTKGFWDIQKNLIGIMLVFPIMVGSFPLYYYYQFTKGKIDKQRCENLFVGSGCMLIMMLIFSIVLLIEGTIDFITS